MKTLQKFVARVLVVSLMCINFPSAVFAAQEEEDPSLDLIHSPLEQINAGEIVHVSAEIEGREGIELARIYFRSAGTTPYYFVPMVVGEDSKYTGLLPAPELTGGSIEYLFLVKTYNNRIFKSQSFTPKVAGRAKAAPAEETVAIDVSTENMQPPTELIGFDPRTKVRTVTNSEKHGVLAGLYDPADTGGSTSNGQYHGTVVASEKSYLNTILLGGGVLAGAAVLVAAAGSSGSGGGSSTTDTTDTGSGATGEGIWTLNYSNGGCTKTTTQTVQCSEEGLVTSVSPAAIGIPLPASCDNSPYAGLSELFVVGGSCDTVAACSSYSSADLMSKECVASSIVLVKDGGTRVEAWTR
jgi:hypothetical protein